MAGHIVQYCHTKLLSTLGKLKVLFLLSYTFISV